MCWLGDLTMAQSGKVSGCIGGFQGAEDYVLTEVKCLKGKVLGKCSGSVWGKLL